MPKFAYKMICPNCSSKNYAYFTLSREPLTVRVVCYICFHPILYNTQKKTAELDIIPIKKKAFLIHSATPRERELLAEFRQLIRLYGINTFVIEEDPRSVDWLQKSLDGITSSDFTLAFLTKRYQFADEKGAIIGWKAPDKCYDEISIAFALHKDILALVEKEVDPGRVLETRAWCYRFEREPKFKGDINFFLFLVKYLGN